MVSLVLLDTYPTLTIIAKVNEHICYNIYALLCLDNAAAKSLIDDLRPKSIITWPDYFRKWLYCEQLLCFKGTQVVWVALLFSVIYHSLLLFLYSHFYLSFQFPYFLSVLYLLLSHCLFSCSLCPLPVCLRLIIVDLKTLIKRGCDFLSSFRVQKSYLSVLCCM